MGRTHRATSRDDWTRRRYAGPFFVTSHAAEQFRDRVCPQLSFGRAKCELMILAATSVRTDHRTGTGDEIWVATDGAPVRFVVRDERGSRTCLTVLEPEQ